MYPYIRFYEKDNQLHEIYIPVQLAEFKRGIEKGTENPLKIQIPLISMKVKT